jgi:thiosulfate dehydrogenase [quinone] large subunit
VVPKGQSATFTIPSSGDPGIVINTNSTFYAYDAVCPHAGCTVGWAPQNSLIVCPCHGSEFNVTTGDVINGPAPHGLTKLKVVEESNGNLYLQ